VLLITIRAPGIKEKDDLEAWPAPVARPPASAFSGAKARYARSNHHHLEKQNGDAVFFSGS
jgi:hypothetical protein